MQKPHAFTFSIVSLILNIHVRFFILFIFIGNAIIMGFYYGNVCITVAQQTSLDQTEQQRQEKFSEIISTYVSICL